MERFYTWGPLYCILVFVYLLITLHYRKKFRNTQLMSMIDFCVLLAAEAEFDIGFSPRDLELAVMEVAIFVLL